eukprot:TRINITY_DN562_c0_g1_i10.p2 TRINITY_DN562_c0_g1~~TRINITY_DN562_c0_g1_i10.p2  ORF type:complete len:575 (+),score=76.98 TRINITY_DN562_c0_g1_i10:141-1865(+)
MKRNFLTASGRKAAPQVESPVSFLKTENLELLQREKEYNALQSRLLDLEHSLKVLHEYKTREENEFHETEYTETRLINNLQSELKTLRTTLAEYETDIKDLTAESESYKNILYTKNSEIQKLKARISDTLEETAQVTCEKRLLETEYSVMEKARDSAKAEVDKLSGINERIKISNREDKENIERQKYEMETIQQRIAEIEEQGSVTAQEIEERDKLLKESQEARKAHEREVEQIEREVIKIKEKNVELNRSLSYLEFEIARTEQTLNREMQELERVDKENREAKYELSYMENKAIETKDQVKKLAEERLELEHLEASTRKNKELQNELLSQEKQKRAELEIKKQRLERTLLEKDIEIANSKRELDRAIQKYQNVREGHRQVSDEAAVLQEHVKVLEQQNEEVHFSLIMNNVNSCKGNWIDVQIRMSGYERKLTGDHRCRNLGIRTRKNWRFLLQEQSYLQSPCTNLMMTIKNFLSFQQQLTCIVHTYEYAINAQTKRTLKGAFTGNTQQEQNDELKLLIQAFIYENQAILDHGNGLEKEWPICSRQVFRIMLAKAPGFVKGITCSFASSFFSCV